MQTILHINNPHVEAFRNAGASLTPLLKEHYVSNWTVNDVQVRSDLDPAVVSVSIDLIAPEDPEQPLPAIVFDPAVDVIQHLSTANFRKLKEQQPELFPAPVAEPDPEPRYRRKMTSNEFVNLLGDELETLILTAAKSSIDIQKYINRMGWADYVDLDDSGVFAGLAGLKKAGLISQEEIDRIMLGVKYE